MGIVKTTKYVCDCCGYVSDDAYFRIGSSCGSSKLTFKGSRGAMGYDGAWGGGNHDIEMLLCFKCSDEIRQSIRDLSDTKKAESGEETT